MIFPLTPTQVRGTTTERAYRDIIRDATCLTVLIAYFLHFALPALRGGFRADEMMNLGIYWYAGTLRSLWANVVFWTTFYRPGGALYYLPLYHFFALDPLPYRIVQISVLAASIPVAYYLSRCLTSSRSVAFLAVLALCYHPQLASLLFIGAFIYDVLCGFFYFAALTYYVHIREKDVCPRPLQLLGFLGLYVCALNSKEMAVTLPVIILIYELLKSPHWTDWQGFFRWSWSAARPSLVAGALTAIYIFGKMHGTTSLTRYDNYRPIISWHRFTASNAEFVTELLLFGQHAITPTTLLILWAGVFIYAFLRRDRTLQLMAFWIVIVPLPIAFVLPLRGGPCLYLLLFGWAMIFAEVACDLIALISRTFMFPGQRVAADRKTEAMPETHDAGGTRDAPILGILRATAGKTPGWTVRIVLISILAVSFALFTEWQNRRLRTVPNLTGVGEKVSHVIAAFNSINLRPAPHSTVLLKPDEQLFQNKWHPQLIASLVWNDHSIQIWTENLSKITPEQLAKVDYIISLTEFQATVIRSPGVHQSE